MKKPYPPIAPPKYLGGEEISRQELCSEDYLPVLDQENFDYVFYKDYYDHDRYYSFLIKKTKQFENVNYEKELKAYKVAKEKHSKDYKAWLAFERERKKQERSERAVKQKDQDYQTYLKLKKKYGEK